MQAQVLRSFLKTFIIAAQEPFADKFSDTAFLEQVSGIHSNYNHFCPVQVHNIQITHRFEAGICQ